jgi:hypothetical protein
MHGTQPTHGNIPYIWYVINQQQMPCAPTHTTYYITFFGLAGSFNAISACTIYHPNNHFSPTRLVEHQLPLTTPPHSIVGNTVKGPSLTSQSSFGRFVPPFRLLLLLLLLLLLWNVVCTPSVVVVVDCCLLDK